MKLRFSTVDVFTGTRFCGNPLAVVLGADSLTTAQMQAVAREFNYSETAFVLLPTNRSNTARLRIFTPSTEVPFAGHPNVGAAFVIATSERYAGPDELHFEEEIGVVSVRIIRNQGSVTGAELIVPQPLSLGSEFRVPDVAECLSLDVTDICVKRHVPVIASVGLPFLIAEIESRSALSRARVCPEVIKQCLPKDGADSIYIYTRDVNARDGCDIDLSSRMFAPWDGLPEDPATGSATAAAVALATRTGEQFSQIVRVAQGVDMGRPCLLEVSACAENGSGPTIRVRGACVNVMEGSISI